MVKKKLSHYFTHLNFKQVGTYNKKLLVKNVIFIDKHPRNNILLPNMKSKMYVVIFQSKE